MSGYCATLRGESKGMFDGPCDKWEGVGSVKYDGFWSPCERCGYSWREHGIHRSEKDKIEIKEVKKVACENYRPHSNDPCMNCGKSAVEHRRREEPTEEKMNKLDDIIEKAKQRQEEAQIVIRHYNLPYVIDKIRDKIQYLVLTRDVHIIHTSGVWEVTLFFKDRRKAGGSRRVNEL